MAMSRLFLVGILSSASILLTPSQLTIAQSQQLTTEEISAIAQPITVRIDGTDRGSGVIIDKSGDIYTVLTNWHVLSNEEGQYEGQYTVQTYDGRKYTVDCSQVQQLSKPIDLAIVRFKSTKYYQIAQLGDSKELLLGQDIYLSGYPDQLPDEPSRIYRILEMILEGIFPTPNKMGYKLTYRGGAFGGYSGSPILDQTGLVIGIHGHVFYSIQEETFSYAIPIDTYKTLAQELAEKIASQPETELVSSNSCQANTELVDQNSANYVLAYNTPNEVSHSDRVTSIAVTEKYIVSGSKDNTIKVWNLKTRQLERTLTGHSDQVTSVAVTEKYIISGSKDKTIKVWNLTTGQLERTLTGHSRRVTGVGITGEKIVSVSYDELIKVWNLKTGKLEYTIKGDLETVLKGNWRFIDMAVNEEQIVTIQRFRIIDVRSQALRVWNLNTKKLEHNLINEFVTIWNSRIYSIAITGKYIVSGIGEKIKVWNLITGELEYTLTGHSSDIKSVAIIGQHIISGSHDKTIKIWNLKTGKLERTLTGHSERVTSIAVTGNYIVSGDWNGNIKVWQLEK